MKRTGSVILVVLGILLILFGLLFLLGSAGKLYRYIIAGVSLGLGGVLTGLGIRFYKQVDAVLPEYIRAEILDLARKHNGEISQDDIRAALGRRFPQADKILAELQVEDICREQKKGIAIYYVFPEIQPRLAIKRCEYCGSQIPLKEDLESCPECGGTIKTKVERLSLSKDDYYSMDE